MVVEMDSVDFGLVNLDTFADTNIAPKMDG